MRLFDKSKYEEIKLRASENFTIYKYADMYLQGIFKIPVEAGGILIVTYRNDEYIKSIELHREKLGKNGFDITIEEIKNHCKRI